MPHKLFLVALLAMFLASGCQEERVGWQLRDIDRLMAAGEYREAEQLCQNILKQLDSATYQQVGQDRRRLLNTQYEIELKYHHSPRRAIKVLKRLLEISPEAEQYRLKLQIADLYEYDLQLPTETVFILNDLLPQAEKEYPAELDVLYPRLIKNLFALKKYEQCRDAVQLFAKKKPASPMLNKMHMIEANSFFIQEEYYKAIAVYRGLLEKKLTSEEQGTVYFELGSCYQMLSNPQKAVDYYRLALPGHPNPQMVQHHITYVQALADMTNVDKQLRRSRMEQNYLQNNAADNEHEMKLGR